MEDFTQWLWDMYMSWNPGWFRLIGPAIWASPLLSATIFGFVLFTAIGGRSVSLTLASAVSGVIALLAAPMPSSAGIEHPLTAASICIQLLMLGGIWRYRRRIASERFGRRKLAAEKHAIQVRLDEEIRWRTAADSTEEDIPTTSPPGGKS